jgi:hypothetical protein
MTDPRHTRRGILRQASTAALACIAGWADDAGVIDLPDPLICEAYQHAARQNVLAAVNPRVFPGYFSVCADGHGFGYGNTYPSLDGHQLTDALLWLNQADVAKANWDYVKSFQHPDGGLPLAILPSKAGQDIGPKGYPGIVEANGGLYKHWVPGNPLAALAAPTFIQNADVIFRWTQDREWLSLQMPSIHLAAGQLASLMDARGAVGGGGYYCERPSRLGCDGVAQSHAIDAFSRLERLAHLLGDSKNAQRYRLLAARIRQHFITHFWMADHFAEYDHPQHGLVDLHGLSDTDWAALAFGTGTRQQQSILWPQLRDEKRFYYGGMPTGIVAEPGKYEMWEFSYPDRMDVAAMGRVWYVECQARGRLGDAVGLLDTLRRVASVGKKSGYYWRERYGADGGHGAEKYCEYPANLIRIVQRFVFGVDLRVDGTLALNPLVPAEFMERGFGQRLTWCDRVLDYRMRRGKISGSYSGGPLTLSVKAPHATRRRTRFAAKINGKNVESLWDGSHISLRIPQAALDRPVRFEIS